MSESDAATTQADLEALRALETDAPELERLEGLLHHFNIFETIGFVNDEGCTRVSWPFCLIPSVTMALETCLSRKCCGQSRVPQRIPYRLSLRFKPTDR